MLKLNTYYLLFAILLVLIIKLVESFYSNILIPKFWIIFIFIGLLTSLAINICIKVTNINTPNSTFVILAVNIIKLLFCMTLVIFYLQIYTVKPVLFILNFFSIYLSFTVFEIYTLLLNLRNLKKKLKTSN